MPERSVWALVLLLAGCGEAAPPAPPPMSVPEALRGSTEGYARAKVPRPLMFPQDHGAHPDFKSEWWYFTGNLEAPDRRRFGFQFTVFRSAVRPRGGGHASAWRTRQVYLGHAALSDIRSQRFYHDERFARGALGLAGASSAPLRVWLEDWQVQAIGPNEPAVLKVRLTARTDDFELDLELASSKPVVLHGDRGLSAKSDTPGNASYYYSYSRLQAGGQVRVAGSAHDVEGLAWFDHEWSTSALEEQQTGWDWFSLQFDDGTELMLFQLRDRRGPDRYYRSGTLVAADGSATRLGPGEFRIETLDEWRSPRTGAAYPARWRITLPSRQLDVHVVPLLADQEMAPLLPMI